jgi:hypothetical protein
MAVKNLKNLLVFAALGFYVQVPSFAAEPGSVATISEAGGTVMVDHGKGFVSSKANEPLFQNDRVITLENSEAEVTFGDGCRTKLKPNNMIVINADPGCKAAILDATKTTPDALVAFNPAALIPPLAGLGIVIASISIE